ncbi:methyltransferase domain-containing protein [Erythrobacter sp. JK5]|uniref:methyltransferase domain-containing protein n=1 Tax=Erythrobacter sp. JK5 TaxID=2829500 RepID=UPI001BA750BD|nr:methyltransferase domain-containing protein [Erythrobacter sp. JK5]QUL38750.1 methyltransferase domain-containing protein [Erythrobacter sp. JK5]
MNRQHVPRIFDRRQAAAKWDRARSRQRRGGASYLVDTMASDIAERLDFMRLQPEHALIVGEATGALQASLASGNTQGKVALLGQFDEEQPGPHAAFDLIVHLLGLGMVNDLPGALIHARNALAPGGLLIAAFPGAGSMPMLRRIALEADGDQPSARMHPLVDNRAATGLLERAGFGRQVVDTYPVRVRYPSLQRMIGDLRDHGLTRSLCSPVPPITRRWVERAETSFDALREDDGKVVETFEILVLTGWRD